MFPASNLYLQFTISCYCRLLSCLLLNSSVTWSQWHTMAVLVTHATFRCKSFNPSIIHMTFIGRYTHSPSWLKNLIFYYLIMIYIYKQFTLYNPYWYKIPKWIIIIFKKANNLKKKTDRIWLIYNIKCFTAIGQAPLAFVGLLHR